MIERMKESVSRFHLDDEGNEMLQSVLLCAIAALIGVALKTLGGGLLGTANDEAKKTMTQGVTASP